MQKRSESNQINTTNLKAIQNQRKQIQQTHKMAMMMFGQFVSNLPMATVQVASGLHSVSSTHSINKTSAQLTYEANATALERLQAFFDTPEMVSKMRAHKYATTKTRRNGTVFLKYENEKVVQKREKRDALLQKFEKDFQAGLFENISSLNTGITIAASAQPCVDTYKSPYWRRTPKRCKQTLKKNKVALRVKCDVKTLEKKLMDIASRNKMVVEFIGTRRHKLKANFKNIQTSTIPCITLPHEKGLRKRKELPTRAYTQEIRTLESGRRIRHAFRDSDITFGWSGAILPNSKVERFSRHDNFVVRGRLHGQLIDARAAISFHSTLAIAQYSFKNEFWDGWKAAFDSLKPQDAAHNCESDLSNAQCGNLAALFVQMVHPCMKLSCKTCRHAIADLDHKGLTNMIDKQVTEHENKIMEMSTRCPSVANVLQFLNRKPQANSNIDDSMEIARLLQGRKANQLQQISRINEVLAKGHLSSIAEMHEATHKLLEITRWFHNHLSLINAGALETFRNKIASKALINPTLMCDNQLDRNGNFVWGERGRHSKRFFANFFEVVEPGDGYKKHAIRKHPNGTRKLAIQNLIVPLSLDRARASFKGEPVEPQPLTESCVSRLDGAFIHTCCCVTDDVGKPLLSTLRSPTKSHLVVGSTTNAKYIDLPQMEETKMYIAKEGYCYLNIFLAMLVNINEDNAKDFTKRLRDILIPKLGMWPSMIDVATVCYMLAIFYPEVRNAELPSMLVDHANQTVHVIDSFGSATTGYHVLKAGTVQQLINFASDELNSEMKHYAVGGQEPPSQAMRMELALIKSIFRPKKLVKIIEEDPYVLMMSLMSPKLLMSLYNVGGLELAMREWITKDFPVSSIFSILTELAQRVSVADILAEQFSIITSKTDQMLELLATTKHDTEHKREIQQICRVVAARTYTDRELEENGFTTMMMPVYILQEKMYGERLNEAWSELSWSERFLQIRHSRKVRQYIIEPLPDTKNDGLKGSCQDWRAWLRGKMKNLYSGAQDLRRRTQSRMYKVATQTVGKSIFYIFKRCYSDIFYFVNVLIVCNVLFSIAYTLQRMLQEAQLNKRKIKVIEYQEKSEMLENLYRHCKLTTQSDPTKQEFLEQVRKVNKDLVPFAKAQIENEEDDVHYQSKTKSELHLEKVVATMALFTMILDPEKSDAVFRVLSKVKTFFGTVEDTVRYQSLDDIQSTIDDKQLVIDFELETSSEGAQATMDVRFEEWWHKQLEQNRVVPHYRLSGSFFEFTRQTAASVANNISTASQTEFLIRGAVGSGKSTGLPHQLSMKGKVLLLEPTRPLAENVCKQLRGDPFHLQPTLRMRGLSTFGSSNISVMTGGFALHYYAHNPALLTDFDFIIIDECHTLDAPTMAFYCLLKEFSFPGKILKVSATPPGKECEFRTQYDVQIKKEDAISFQNFVQAQGTGSNADVIAHGNNILIYVASYNDVDQLSDLLTKANHKVTKVDGRTMKMGHVEIPTKGTSQCKHFVVATNIIENGVTLDIDVVVDFGQKVVAELDIDDRCMRYKKVSISYGERIQRLGRVGRVKPGVALRIGHTEQGMVDIPVAIATEAAFLCFAYGLPVMTHNVTTSLLNNCTTNKAKTMMQFELSPFFTADLVNFRGSMHPAVHALLKPFKLRESEIELSTLSIPNACISQWLSVANYEKVGIRINAPKEAKIPFFARGIPDKLFEQLWKVVTDYKSDANFGKLTSACATKVAYTLSTEPSAIPRTVAIIDQLITEEMQKKAHFEALSTSVCTHKFTLKGIVDTIRSRYMTDHSKANIERLQQARAQLLNFSTAHHDFSKVSSLLSYGYLETVQYQSKDEIGKALQLKGRWNGSLLTQDLAISGMVLVGGVWMAWEHFRNSSADVVMYQSKRKNQKLKFREARDRKVGREVYGEDGEIEHYFGAAYTTRGKVKGNHTTKGLGKKSRNFVHMYGFDPAEYSFIRFLDPLTGATLDESTTCDVSLVQSEFGALRQEKAMEDDDFNQRVRMNPGIEAYFLNSKAQRALKVDLTPHNPLAVGNKSASIAGYPEREFELRQTGPATVVPYTTVPEKNEMDEVVMEGKSIHKGLRNYNPIAVAVCKLTNDSDGIVTSMYGIGYGPVIISNGHLFRRNNGTLKIQSHHGVFTVPNTTKLDMHHIKDKDMVVIRMPKDFPPFPMKIRFRSPIKGEKSCLVGSLFQQRSISSVVSESTVVTPSSGGSYWQHWVSTKDGDCGLPIVAISDGVITGFHGLEGTKTKRNYFVPFSDDFTESVLGRLDLIEWQRHWLHTIDKVSWGGLQLKSSEPEPVFRISKLISDLQDGEAEIVREQAAHDRWVHAQLRGNLKAVAQAPSQLVTKHVIKGECTHFIEYLAQNDAARDFFTPLMGEYRPSKLNREAFNKDFLKYAGPIVVGVVDPDIFRTAVTSVINLLRSIGFSECRYITDTESIISSLNMKAAVGALYSGKKNEYFLDVTDEQKDQLLYASCERLFLGHKGVWNGSLKAELRPNEKVDQNKTRTFTAAPLDTLLGAKVCVDDFNNQFYSLNLKGPWTVGMTKFYGGWDKLLRQLPDDWLYCHADGSRFDSSLTPFLINAVIEVRHAFMEEWDFGYEMLRNLYTEIIYTPILTPDGTIVKKFKGNNSGQPSTVVDNTLMVIITMYYSLHRCGWSSEMILANFAFFANGDDLIIAVNPQYRATLDTLQSSFLELGLNYDFSERTFERQELWFMSHQGIEKEGIYIPKLEPERIVSILEWDRCATIEHRMEAICAAMIEAWGHDDLLKEIRRFYLWMLQQDEMCQLVAEDKFPYITETALRKLYTDREAIIDALAMYEGIFYGCDMTDVVSYQANDDMDAGASSSGSNKPKAAQPQTEYNKPELEQPLTVAGKKDLDVDAGKRAISIPRLQKLSSKMKLPLVLGKPVINIAHLLEYKPDQVDLSNTRATQIQFKNWYEAIMHEYELDDSNMSTIMNGFMVWCIENGTSPNINGVWVMMEGETQIEFPLRPIVENAKPTLRQIMHHFSDAAEAYIEMRNAEKPYMPRYGLQRNLRDKSLARYAFDFYEVTAKTPDRAREAHMQMKAAALGNTTTRMFGLDGNIATQQEDTERHTANDVNANMHSLLGVRGF
ncbi:polyprotein [Achyranthes virus A]|uniref:Genome polyprotein n=1 Tax=Achyranthes virus A TaxID=2753665 RepID=A0ABX6QUS9_9POTV|nr:polyprotein [Achyranthes virus A]QLH94015.1 polyprotein [Achyranthes virus A]